MASLTEFLTPEEIQQFTQKSNARGAWEITKCWLMIAVILTMTALWTNPLTVVLAFFLLGGRQLHLAILMHDAGHQLLFKQAKTNITIGNWCAAYVLFLNTEHYAKQHNHHHGFAGTPKDPDLANFRAYPVERTSFSRKIARDIFGITGFKFIVGLLLNKTGLMEKDAAHYQTVLKGIALHCAIIVAASLSGVLWLYGLWMAAFFSSYMLVLRIRQAAEHGAVRDSNSRDPRDHTRTTLASWWEQLLFAPANVNYHVEHHLVPNVPCYRLRELHILLKQRGYFANHPVTSGYMPLLKELIL